MRVELTLQLEELDRVVPVHRRQGGPFGENVLDQVDAAVEFLPEDVGKLLECRLGMLEPLLV